MDVLEKEIIKLQRDSSFDQSIEDVDKIIQQLEKARDAIESEPQFASITLTKLQHPLKNGFEKVNDDIKKIHKAHGTYGKAVNSNLPKQTLLNEIDALSNHTELVNRAITMHLLREGQFGVASTFYEELQNMKKNSSGPGADSNLLAPEDETVDEELQGEFETIAKSPSSNRMGTKEQQGTRNSRHKLQFVWLFLGPETNGLPDDENNGLPGALQYARDYFPRFQSRFLKEIQQLITAMVFESNLQRSPYQQTFDTSSSWSDVCTSFTREFCSFLGLSAESPLYLAATAGAIALPTLIKLATIQKTKRTNWTTDT
ncbi:hypothetical protein BOTNAR_0255g00080 [Botryotinia narcissicola]|uniref:CRA domain-containing protein n=1 Tax=Botryotinia narcissicola TaxID=278944 RepID=A0A4Z1I068_9HELO|nr:hypothetical protein BOTNAR_0255g00080 [Botryotinia narcissicola]